ncbi:hypothetical protein EMCRGX_G010960 [Ephydatia muelleri]
MRRRCFVQYSFVEAACTTAGCQTGGVANVTTLDSGVHLWAKLPPHPQYHFLFHVPPMECSPPTQLCHHCLHLAPSSPSLKSQSEMWAPPSTATVQFHTYNPSGILFYQINSDFLGVKLHGGLPWLIFDVGSGPAVVGSNSTRTFNDGQWHTGLFEQASNIFYVTVDTVHVLYCYLCWPWGLTATQNPQGQTKVYTTIVLANNQSILPYGGAYSHSPIPQLEQDVTTTVFNNNITKMVVVYPLCLCIMVGLAFRVLCSWHLLPSWLQLLPPPNLLT